MDAMRFINEVAREIEDFPTKPKADAVREILIAKFQHLGLEVLAEEVMAENGRCPGGEELAAIHWDAPCPKCGATDDQACKFET